MMNKNVRGILALAVVTALSFGVIAGSKALTTGMEGNTAAPAEEVKALEELDTAGAENIEKAVKTETGYLVTVKGKGYGGDIIMDVAFDAEGKKITGVTVKEQSETEGLGAKIAEAEFLSQFEGVEAPVYLPGMTVGEGTSEEAEETAEEAPAVNELEGAVLADGSYIAKAEPDDNGFVEQVTMTVADGKITEVVWDAITADGTKKSVMSENGEYTMTEDGLTWKEQAEALATGLIENQELGFLNMNEQGKTDAVSGVSIYVGGFAGLAEQCMKEAAGLTKTVVLNDGTYEAKAEPDDKGFVEQVTMTVADGKITEVVWDAITADGTKKSVMSENGEYTMTEDGLTWKEQAEALAAGLIENQELGFLNMNEQGKTDAVSGVSIYVGGFAGLAEQCILQAAGEDVIAENTVTEVEAETKESVEEVEQEGTQVDAVSGATISSTAAVTAINDAYAFLMAAK